MNKVKNKTNLQAAIDYLEAHLKEKIDYEEAAKCAYCSRFHFERIFGMVYGITPSEYVRRRRFTLAAEMLSKGTAVLDAALSFGYDSPEGFSRAFKEYFGILPSDLGHGCHVSSIPCFEALKIGDNDMTFSIEIHPAVTLMGYRKHFEGAPYGKRRAEQEDAFFSSTRAKQWLLIGASDDPATDYCVITNQDENGYDFFIGYTLDAWTMSAIYDSKITGIDCIDKFGFEKLTIPRAAYAVFRTKKSKNPLPELHVLRREIAAAWPSEEYTMKNAPEIVLLHWRPLGNRKKERYIEIRIPVEDRREV